MMIPTHEVESLLTAYESDLVKAHEVTTSKSLKTKISHKLEAVYEMRVRFRAYVHEKMNAKRDEAFKE